MQDGRQRRLCLNEYLLMYRNRDQPFSLFQEKTAMISERRRMGNSQPPMFLSTQGRRKRHWHSLHLSGFLFLAIAFLQGANHHYKNNNWVKGVDAFVHQFPPTNSAAIERTRVAKFRGNYYKPTTTSLQLAVVFETVEPLVSIAKTATDGYATALVQNPLPTKSLTAGLLCGIGDVIAQKRAAAETNNNDDDFDPKRTLRFASKGCLGGILWMYWYDWIDGFLTYTSFADETAAVDTASRISFYTLVGTILPPPMMDVFRDHSGAVKTAVSMVLEQLVWCPLVYGTFEIPLSTLLNGARPQTIPMEVKSKLNGLLWSNFQVWTPANLVIYNAPLEWRLFLGNIIDLFWQSIVSDVAADCGGEEECELPEDDQVLGDEVERTMAALAAETARDKKLGTIGVETVSPEPLSAYAKENRVR